MTPHEQFRDAAWHKSSYSQGATQCVEIATSGTNVAIRDSKNPAGPILVLTAEHMRTFIDQIKTHQLGHAHVGARPTVAEDAAEPNHCRDRAWSSQ